MFKPFARPAKRRRPPRRKGSRHFARPRKTVETRKLVCSRVVRLFKHPGPAPPQPAGPPAGHASKQAEKMADTRRPDYAPCPPRPAKPAGRATRRLVGTSPQASRPEDSAVLARTIQFSKNSKGQPADVTGRRSPGQPPLPWRSRAAPTSMPAAGDPEHAGGILYFSCRKRSSQTISMTCFCRCPFCSTNSLPPAARSLVSRPRSSVTRTPFT